MSFNPWSVALVCLVVFGLAGLAGFGVVTGAWLLVMIAAGLAAPAILLRDSPVA